MGGAIRWSPVDNITVTSIQTKCIVINMIPQTNQQGLPLTDVFVLKSNSLSSFIDL